MNNIKNNYIGYARISTSNQTIDSQIHALTKAGCSKIFQDIGTGVKPNGLEEFNKLKTYLRKDDVLVVYKLDRVSRNLKSLISFIDELKIKGVGFKSLTEKIDTTTASGELTLNLFAILAKFERDQLVERTKAGLEAARANGKILGRPEVLNKEKKQLIKTLKEQGKTNTSIAEILGVSRSTIQRELKNTN